MKRTVLYVTNEMWEDLPTVLPADRVADALKRLLGTIRKDTTA